MTVAKAEPRGLTIPDLMILVAGTALAMSLPNMNFRPPLDPRPGQFSNLGNLWAAYLHEQFSRASLVLGLLGWSRCIRYRRLIRAPELLALAMGWYNVFLAMIDWDHGWVQLWDFTEVSPRGISSSLNMERFRLWNGSWAIVGLFSVALMAIGPARRRIPIGLVPLLMVLGWHGFGYALPLYLDYVPMLEENRVGVEWALAVLRNLFFQLPLAAALLSLRRRPPAGWPLTTWLALSGSFATVGAGLAVRFTGHPLRGSWRIPASQWFWQYPYLAIPPVVLLLDILLLAWATRPRRTQGEPPA